jgi:hypothetical protein
MNKTNPSIQPAEAPAVSGAMLSPQVLAERILVIRGQRVLLDADLAQLYGVETKKFNQQVKRNPARFPQDFMFRLTEEEFESLRSQNVTSKRGGRRYLPLGACAAEGASAAKWPRRPIFHRLFAP